jgi:hypothetical protein
MRENTQISRDNWPEYCVTFTHGNRGRLVPIEVVGDDVGEMPMTDSTPFTAIDFDPLLKGDDDDFVISFGGEAPSTSHIVSTPVELWEAQDENRKVVALEIVDLNGHKTILSFD